MEDAIRVMEEAAEAAWWTKADFHGVRQVAPGRWLYTCRNAGALWPIGYCSVACRHDTPEAAEWHYREYLLDSAQFGGRWAGKEYRCEVCRAWTDRFAILKSYVVHPLCRAHLNRDGLDIVVERP
jgi:hypothetical protein